MKEQDKFSNHELAMNEIAEKLGVERVYVRKVITDAFFFKLKTYLKYPYILILPYLGRFIPDMRRYGHFERRAEKLKKLIEKNRNRKS